MLLRTITDEIMQAIAKLSGQEYVDIDARRAKAEMAGGGRGSDHASGAGDQRTTIRHERRRAGR